MTSVAKLPVPDDGKRQREKFALWSKAYDESPNPVLSVEERYLAPILPELRAKDVLDVGCGTGRWLGRVALSDPRSMTGIDFSPEMLDRARHKLGGQAVLVLGNATSLPIASSSADVVLASFVASYVDDLQRFASELRRVLRSGGSVYISDIHPATATTCNWKRGFRSGEQQVGFTTSQRSLREIMQYFEASGFETLCRLEPPFGLAELETFRGAGKLESFYAAAGLPAIYILQLRPVGTRSLHVVQSANTDARIHLAGARVALAADLAIGADISVEDGRVSSLISSPPRAEAGNQSDAPTLDGYLLLPGLINAHDHLEFGLYPNLGTGPYANSQEWANDIQRTESARIAAHRAIPKDVRLWWGAIRNLLCGVTTVCHHNPLHPELLKDEFPIRVVTNFGWAHSLAMDTEVEVKFGATSPAAPFVIHACEGLDEASRNEVFRLDDARMLDQRTILVHGLGLDAEGIALLNRRDAAIVWCPSSNRFLFGRTHTRTAIASIRHLLLGSDSPLTAAGDLLDEVRIAHHEVGVPAEELYSMLLPRAVAAFHLRDGEGAIRPDAAADLIAVRDKGMSPADTLANLTASDVELVIVRGRVQVASDALMRKLSPEWTAGLQPLQIGRDVRWVRAPLGYLFREAERELGCNIKICGKRVRHVCSAWL